MTVLELVGRPRADHQEEPMLIVTNAGTVR